MPTLFMRISLPLLACLLLILALCRPFDAQAQRNQEAWELMKMGQLDTAKMVADADVEAEPGKRQAVSWYTRGMVYKAICDRDDYQERHPGEYLDLTAFDSYKKAIALDETHVLTDGILEDIVSLTEDFCTAGLDLFEKGYDGRNTFKLAQAARYLDAVAEAFLLLGPRQISIHKALQDYGIDKRTLEVCRAMAKDMAGANDEARRLYEELVKQKTQEAAVYLGLKDVYIAQRQKGMALAVLEQGRINAPKSLEVSLAYAELLADTGRAAEGRTLAGNLARQYPDEPGPQTSLGFIEEKRQNAQVAEQCYEKALDLDPADFLANFRLGKLYFKQAEENKSKGATTIYVRQLQEKSLHFAEAAAQASPKHFGNNRILLELYQTLGLTDKAQLLKTEMN
jgi:tetratricopeptide (TPR) repeat protein